MRFVCPVSNSSRSHTVPFLAALVTFYAVGVFCAKGLIAIDLPILQLWFTPAVLLALFFFSLKGYRIPKILVMLCALFVFGTFLSARVYLSARGHVLVARMSGDSADAETRIFREKLNTTLSDLGTRSTEPLYAAIRNQQDAEQFLGSHPKVEMLLWGSKRWLNISFGKEPPFEISAATASATFLNYYGLKLADTVRWVGLSYEPEPATLLFLSRLITGYMPLRQYAAEMKQDSIREHKSLLIAAGRHRDLWSARWHRAIAALKAANYRFAELLQLPSYDEEKMKEVMDLYQLSTALASTTREHAELYAAARNNMAVAAFMDSQLRANKQSRKKALKLLRVVLSFGRHVPTRTAYGPAWTLVKDNMKWIQEYAKKRRGTNGKKARRQKNGHRRNGSRAASSRPA